MKPPPRDRAGDLGPMESRRWIKTDGPLARELVLVPGGPGLGLVPERTLPDTMAKAICGFCSTGCELNVHIRAGLPVNVTPSIEYPVNLGMACPKGWEALAALTAPDRGTTPLARDARGRMQRVTWRVALRRFTECLQDIQRRHGKEAIAFLSTGQIATEEMALLGALAKFGMGIVHGDGNTRQCMATAVVAYKESFGFDAPPYTYRDFEESDVIVLVGANVCIAHPILWQRIVRNPHRPEIIVLDPRNTETAQAATRHISLRPKSDLVFLYGLARMLIANGWIHAPFVRKHTTGFEEFAQHVADFSPARVAEITGISPEEQFAVARIIHEGRRVSFWWTMGVNQSYEGVRTAQAIINVALLTGNIGRPGTGANSITGQCNAMGSRLFSNTTNLLGGHDFANPVDRRKVAGILEIEEDRIPRSAGWSYNEIMEGILAGRIRGLWVICTNPAHSWINQITCHDILDRLEFLVVQDMYPTTETALRAHLYLPAAGWGEKLGTFINSERRIGLIQKVAKAPGEALADFAIFRLIAEAWGCGDQFRRWTSPEAVFHLLRALSKGQPCDFSGIQGYEHLARKGGIQWPYPAEGCDDAPERRLFSDGQFFHADGKARFCFGSPEKMPEPPNERYPFLLLTGRGTTAQWHTQTRTGKSAVLDQLCPRALYVEVNPRDARREGIQPNQRVVVESRRGRVVATAFLTYGIQPGTVFMPMHYATTNRLTLAHFDPYSKQPSYKDCAVSIRPLEPHEAPDS